MKFSEVISIHILALLSLVLASFLSFKSHAVTFKHLLPPDAVIAPMSICSKPQGQTDLFSLIYLAADFEEPNPSSHKQHLLQTASERLLWLQSRKLRVWEQKTLSRTPFPDWVQSIDASRVIRF